MNPTEKSDSLHLDLGSLGKVEIIPLPSMPPQIIAALIGERELVILFANGTIYQKNLAKNSSVEQIGAT